MDTRLGEVIEASTTEFTAQSYELYRLPPLGTLVKTPVAGVDIYGIVYNAATSSLEPGRKPIARGKDETNSEAIYQSNPQLLKLFRSEFEALVVGHKQDGKIYQYLPPQPARIHEFVHQCSPGEVREFSRSPAFLNILLNARVSVAVEELVAASLREIGRVQEDRRAYLVSAGKELAILLGGQYNRLHAILGGLNP
jgi:hypothetical protein